MVVLMATRRRRKPAPVTAVRPHREVWRTALDLAHGDRSRLRVEPDGSVLVVNRH